MAEFKIRSQSSQLSWYPGKDSTTEPIMLQRLLYADLVFLNTGKEKIPRNGSGQGLQGQRLKSPRTFLDKALEVFLLHHGSSWPVDQARVNGGSSATWLPHFYWILKIPSTARNRLVINALLAILNTILQLSSLWWAICLILSKSFIDFAFSCSLHRGRRHLKQTWDPIRFCHSAREAKSIKKKASYLG